MCLIKKIAIGEVLSRPNSIGREARIVGKVARIEGRQNATWIVDESAAKITAMHKILKVCIG